MHRFVPFALVLLAACRSTDKSATDTGGTGDGADPVTDDDGDGVPAEDDCDDTDPDVGPDAEEVPYNGVDDDCDEATPDDDLDGDGAPLASDCDDTDPAVNPAADEVCNDIDDDCNGEVDEAGGGPWFSDVDGDGYGGTEVSTACEAPSGAVDNGDDCDDTTADSYPGATEICDERDNDCDDAVDEGVQSTFYADTDEDGWGDAAATTEACAAPVGYAGQAGDCDDTDSAVSPAATEVCDTVDNDCDGATDEDDAADATEWFEDADGDGYGDAAASFVSCEAPSGHVDNADDCDDTDAAISPETIWNIDYDSDGYGSTAFTLASCTQPTGYVADATDCDDAAASVNPGATEVCNSVDDDCDGLTDDDDPDGPGSSTFYADTDSDGYGDLSTTTTGCAAPTGYVADNTDCDDTDAAINPGGTETCDGVDEDCDGIEDDGVLGTGAACPAETCLDVLADQPSAADGDYQLDPDGDGTADTYTCDMTTDGGGWTEVVAWDRENNGDTLSDFEALLTERYNNMGRWEDKTDHIRWCDYNANSDVMAYELDVEVPNDGESLTFVHYAGEDGMGNSGTWFHVVAGGSEADILCNELVNNPATYYNSTEVTYFPTYTCANTASNWTWNQTEQDDFGVEIDTFRITSFHRDGSGTCGDNSRLYSFDFWVR